MRKKRFLWLVALSGAAASLTVSLLLAEPGAGGPPSAERASVPDVRPNIRINAPQVPAPDGQLGRAGEAVAADAGGEQLVAAWENIHGFCGPPVGRRCTPPARPGITSFGYSKDGGRTWVDGGAPPVVDSTVTGGHPWLDRGGADKRTFFLVSRGWDAAKVIQKGLTFHRGRFTDGAFAWQDGRLLAPPDAGDVYRGCSVAAAKDGSGLVLVTLTNLRALCGPQKPGGPRPPLGFGQIEVLRSDDSGSTWSKPVVVSPSDNVETPDHQDPRCGDSGTVQVAASTALGPDHTAYLIWQRGPYLSHFSRKDASSESDHNVRLYLSRSLDAGRSWSPPRELVALQSLRVDPPVGYSGDTVNDIARIAVAMDGPHRGRIFVTYASAVAPAVPAKPTEQCAVSTQAFVISSDDQGLHWSAPRPLGPPVPPAGVKRFWPVVAAGADGAVDVVYAESQERQVTAAPDDDECRVPLTNKQTRIGKLSSLVDLYRVTSRDGGATFGAPRRITGETSNWCAARSDPGGILFANFGDYLGLATGGRRLFTVWTDGRNGVPDAYFAALPAGDPAAAPNAEARRDR